jgi:hypothetical protein
VQKVNHVDSDCSQQAKIRAKNQKAAPFLARLLKNWCPEEALKPPISGYPPLLVEIALGGLFKDYWPFLYRTVFFAFNQYRLILHIEGGLAGG